MSATARRLATVIQEAAKHLTPLRRALGVSSDKVRETSPEAVLVSPQAQPSPGSYLAASALLEDHTTVPDQYPVGASQPAAAVRAPLLRAADPSTEVQHLQLELAPPELGAVTLRLQHHGREVTASLLVDHEQARQVVQHAEVEVRQSLEQQGLQMGAFDVSCRQQGQNHEAPAQQEGLPYLPVTTEVNHEPAPPRSGPSPSPGSPAAIDVYV